MQFHQVKITKRRTKRRVGRGGKRGTYSGRGIKGQKARAGAKIRPAERDILKKIPKLRGYKFKRFRPKNTVINLGALQEKFAIGEEVSPESLIAKGLVNKFGNKTPGVKILGQGELKKKLLFKNVYFSKSAKTKIANVDSPNKSY